MRHRNLVKTQLGRVQRLGDVITPWWRLRTIVLLLGVLLISLGWVYIMFWFAVPARRQTTHHVHQPEDPSKLHRGDNKDEVEDKDVSTGRGDSSAKEETKKNELEDVSVGHSKPGIENIHVLISTGCSTQQHWEAEVLIYTWKKLNHPGRITRIVSGCKTEDERNLNQVSAIEGVSFFFTNDYSPPEGEDNAGRPFHYFNKPFSIKQFFETAHIYNGLEDIVVLLDPDMLLFEIFDNASPESDFFVSEGHPASALYAIGTKWIKWNLCDVEDCHIDGGLGMKHYSVGPPYIMHKADWRKVAPLWVEHSPAALEREPTPSTLAEMYSFAIACAHLGLRHNSMKKSFVTTPSSEYWEPWKKMDIDIHNLKPRPDIPIIHYCQGQWIGESYPKSSYRQGGFNFHKGHVPKDILEDCGYPLLVPMTLDGPRKNEWLAKDKTKHKRYLWMLHWIIETINEGVANYKRKYCPGFVPEYKLYLQEDDVHKRPSTVNTRFWYTVAAAGEEINLKNKYGPHYSTQEVLRVPSDWESSQQYNKSLWNGENYL